MLQIQIEFLIKKDATLHEQFYWDEDFKLHKT